MLIENEICHHGATSSVSDVLHLCFHVCEDINISCAVSESMFSRSLDAFFFVLQHLIQWQRLAQTFAL